MTLVPRDDCAVFSQVSLVPTLDPLCSGVSFPRSLDDLGRSHLLAKVAVAAAELRQAEPTPAASCDAPHLRTWGRSRRSKSSPYALRAVWLSQTPMLPG